MKHSYVYNRLEAHILIDHSRTLIDLKIQNFSPVDDKSHYKTLLPDFYNGTYLRITTSVKPSEKLSETEISNLKK